MDTALLIIDAQLQQFEPDPVYRAAELLATLSELIHRARAAGAPVIFVRHASVSHDGATTRPDTPAAGPIHPALKPLPSEVIVDKHRPDSFYQTTLAGELAGLGIRRLVITGLLTELCVDATVRQANSLDYDVTLVDDGHSTTSRSGLSASQIITHHNEVLRAFADVRPAAEITFSAPPLPAIELPLLSAADRAAIGNGLAELAAYETWLTTGQGHPFWPHTHPGYLADAFRAMWDANFSPRNRYPDPPRWEVGLARAFMRPLQNIPPAFRKTNLQAVKGAIDHLLQNPRNPLSTQIRPLDDPIWLYESRDLRLFYVPHVGRDQQGNERHVIFLVWLAPGVPVINPFA